MTSCFNMVKCEVQTLLASRALGLEIETIIIVSTLCMFSVWGRSCRGTENTLILRDIKVLDFL